MPKYILCYNVDYSLLIEAPTAAQALDKAKKLDESEWDRSTSSIEIDTLDPTHEEIATANAEAEAAARSKARGYPPRAGATRDPIPDDEE